MKKGFMNYIAKGGKAEAYFSNPEGSRPLGQVIVVHEVWGFTPFIQDACKRLSQAGFLAVAPVLYWRHKRLFSAEIIREGTKAVWGLSLEERHRRASLEAELKKRRVSREAASMLRILYSKQFRGKLLQDLKSLTNSMRKEHPDLRTAAMGFSMGGKLALQLAGSKPELAGCVTYSAEPAPGETFGKISAPMLLLYGMEDRFMLRNLPAFVKEAIEKKKEFEIKMYHSAGHEFFDHTDEKEFRSSAADDAWDASVRFLRKNLTVGR